MKGTTIMLAAAPHEFGRQTGPGACLGDRIAKNRDQALSRSSLSGPSG